MDSLSVNVRTYQTFGSPWSMSTDQNRKCTNKTRWMVTNRNEGVHLEYVAWAPSNRRSLGTLCLSGPSVVCYLHATIYWRDKPIAKKKTRTTLIKPIYKKGEQSKENTCIKPSTSAAMLTMVAKYTMLRTCDHRYTYLTSSNITHLLTCFATCWIKVIQP
jgi:hypothetical protein